MNTAYFLNTVAGNVFKTKENPALPAEYYIGLSSTAPNVNGTGVTEPAGAAGYARVKLSDLGAPANGVVSNTADINFPESTASWGTVSHFVIFDAQNDGNLLMYGALSTARSIEPATVMTIKGGYLKLSVQNPAA